MNVIELKGLTYKYSVGTPFESTAVDNVDLTIEKGEFCGIIGHTGSGKSTLIQHLNGLVKPTSGEVLIDGRNIWSKGVDIRSIRFKVGLVFQYSEYQLFEETVYKDIAYGPKNMGCDEAEIDRRVREAAENMGIREELCIIRPLGYFSLVIGNISVRSFSNARRLTFRADRNAVSHLQVLSQWIPRYLSLTSQRQDLTL